MTPNYIVQRPAVTAAPRPFDSAPTETSGGQRPAAVRHPYDGVGPPHTDAFFMCCVAFRDDASTHMHGSIVTERNAMHGKRVRVGRG